MWYFVWGDNGNRPELLKARAEQQSLWTTFDEKQRKAANLEAYRQQLAEIERTFGAMLRQLPGKTEVPSLARRHLADGPRGRPAGTPVPARW